jgi:anaerobic selenocysteine-containing dehydrogenase
LREGVSPIHVMHLQGTNPLVAYPNTAQVKEGLLSVDFLSVADLYMSPTAEYADIVLPVAHWLETDDILDMHPRFMIGAINKVVDPPGEAWPDNEILNELGKRIAPEYWFNDVEEMLDYELRKGNITWKEFSEMGFPLCANIDETTPSEKLVYNGGRRKDGTCLIANQRRPMPKTNPEPKYQNRKSYLVPNAGGFLLSTSCASWKKSMVAPSVARSAPSFVGKDYTLPICPSGGNNEPWDSWRACHPRSADVSPKIQPSKRWLGCGERTNVFALVWNRQR